MDVLLVVVGVVMLVLGALGVSGRLDRSRFTVYAQNGEPPGPRTHRRLQRLGGVAMLVGGTAFVVVGLV